MSVTFCDGALRPGPLEPSRRTRTPTGTRWTRSAPLSERRSPGARSTALASPMWPLTSVTDRQRRGMPDRDRPSNLNDSACERIGVELVRAVDLFIYRRQLRRSAASAALTSEELRPSSPSS